MKFLSCIIFFSIIPIILNCPVGSIQGIAADNCYKLVGSPSNFFIAEENCFVNEGGHVASVHSAFENAFLMQEAKNLFVGSTDFWLGGTTSLMPGNWSWTDNTTLNYQNWDKGQPTGYNGNLCLTQQISNSLWYSVDCSLSKPYVCKVPASGINLSSTRINPTSAVTRSVATGATRNTGNTQSQITSSVGTVTPCYAYSPLIFDATCLISVDNFEAQKNFVLEDMINVLADNLTILYYVYNIQYSSNSGFSCGCCPVNGPSFPDNISSYVNSSFTQDPLNDCQQNYCYTDSGYAHDRFNNLIGQLVRDFNGPTYSSGYPVNTIIFLGTLNDPSFISNATIDGIKTLSSGDNRAILVQLNNKELNTNSTKILADAGMTIIPWDFHFDRLIWTIRQAMSCFQF